MKVAQLLEQRRSQWRELETLCHELERHRIRHLPADGVFDFARLYRAACADLALADAYQLPAETTRYLHQLVGRAHNQLYRSQMFRWRQWAQELFFRVPRRLLHDRALWLAMAIFWGTFLLAMLLAASSLDFSEEVLGEALMAQLKEMYSVAPTDRDANTAGIMTGFYVMHNAGIGLRCFVGGLFFGIGGLLTTIFNAVQLGAIFGFMLTTPQRDNFVTFVTAHGPFELTAIVLSAAAGMRLGFSLVATNGLSRGASLRGSAVQAMPAAATAVLLFALAALIEGFISPSAAPYEVKLGVAVLSTLVLLVYFVGLGLWARES